MLDKPGVSRESPLLSLWLAADDVKFILLYRIDKVDYLHILCHAWAMKLSQADYRDKIARHYAIVCSCYFTDLRRTHNALKFEIGRSWCTVLWMSANLLRASLLTRALNLF